MLQALGVHVEQVAAQRSMGASKSEAHKMANPVAGGRHFEKHQTVCNKRYWDVVVGCIMVACVILELTRGL